MSICGACGRPDGSVCRPCLEGNPPAEKVAADLAGRGGTRVCIRGCTIYRRHLGSCFAQDRSEGAWLLADLDDQQRDHLMDADLAATSSASRRAGIWVGRYGGLEEWHTCRGCLPRDAMGGSHLCEQCHGKLAEWLGLLPWLFGWLDVNVAPSTTSSARQDWQRAGSVEGTPAPIRVSVLDLRTLLTDRLVEIEDCVRDVFDRPARGGVRFSVLGAVKFLVAWQDRIEGDLDLVNHVFDLLEDLVRRARQVVPWEDRPRRIQAIQCPKCERESLEVRAGMEDVTCRACRATIPKQRYEIWTRILASEARSDRAG